METSAGLAIVYKDRILLGHPTGTKWWKTYSIPKGWHNKKHDLDYMETAIRETREEVGLGFETNELDPTLHKCIYKNKKGEIVKFVYWYKVDCSNFPKKFVMDVIPVVPKELLQLDEIDWAGWLTEEDARKRILPQQISILDTVFGGAKI